jgi:hypothetical protein
VTTAEVETWMSISTIEDWRMKSII